MVLGDPLSFHMGFVTGLAGVKLAFFGGFRPADRAREVQREDSQGHCSLLSDSDHEKLVNLGHFSQVVQNSRQESLSGSNRFFSPQKMATSGTSAEKRSSGGRERDWSADSPLRFPFAERAIIEECTFVLIGAVGSCR
jgi:hypothetical protein